MPLILGAQSALAATGVVTNSCRFDAASNTYMHRTQTAGNRKTWTLSMWVKRSDTTAQQCCVSVEDGASYVLWKFNTSEYFEWRGDIGSARFITNAKYQDPGSWFHVVTKCDTTQSVEANRFKIWINGTQVTSFGTETYPTLNADTYVNNSGGVLRIGADEALTSDYSGYLAEVVLTDGTAYDASSFGEFDSDSPTIWKPIDVSGLTFGTNGFYLDFEDSSDFGSDVSGQGNDLTDVNLTAIDQTTDTPINNFATWNPLARNHGDTGSLSEGNTAYTISSNTYNTKSTLAMTAGKWYWEQKATFINARVGVMTSQANNNLDTDSAAFYWGSTGYGGVHTVTATDSTNWQLTNNDTSSNISTLPGTAVIYVAGDIVMIALDVDTGKMWYGLNGTWFNSGDPGAGTTPIVTVTNSSPDPFVVNGSMGTGTSATISVNFGNPSYAITSSNEDGNGYGNFEYAVPSGFYALCTKNLAEFG